MCVEVKGQLAGIGSLLSRESWGHNTSYQTCGQVLLPAEPYLLLSLTVHVCGLGVCTWVQASLKARGVGSSGAGGPDSCEASCVGSWN